MSYLAVDLDALNVMPDVASAAGIDPGAVAHGLLKLWAWCFREEVEVVSEVHLKGFFGVDAGPALEAFGFLARDGASWRVRGAQRYLRVKAAQREGGKKGRAKSSSPVGRTQPRSISLSAAPTSGSTSAPTSGTEQALTPNTEHRTPNTEHREDCADARLLDVEPVPVKKRAKTPKPPKPVDPRHAPTVAELVRWSCPFDGGRDAANVSALLALATQSAGEEGAPTEVVARWRRALESTGWPTVRSLSQLRTHWGHFAAPASIVGTGPIRCVGDENGGIF